MDEEVDEIVQEFLIESYENLDQLDKDLVELEQDPDSSELIGRIFRVVHTIKGTCGFLGYTKLEAITHAGENLLSKVRDGLLKLDADRATVLLHTVDAIREMLGNIEQIGREGITDYAPLLIELRRLGELEAAQGAPAVAPAVADVPEAEMLQAQPEFVAEPKAGVDVGVHSAPVPNPSQEPAQAASRSASTSSSVANQSVRIDVDLLDKLMNLVGELVLARNQVLQFAGSLDSAGLQSTSQRLNLVTSELQEGVMKTRMQAIDRLWSKLPRVVRDLSTMVGKDVRLEMIGKDTELDRTLVEAIRDPMTHLVRNAVDHGLEDPDERERVGKPRTGVLTLRAYHEGGLVNIEISDDGRGIDVEVVRRKAVERGAISAERAPRMSDRELRNLLFEPGFSTAKTVSNISGRGVGMDVVRTNIENIGGSVDISSELGQGTTVRVKIPLTLAIIPALLIGCGEERFAIPQVSLVELLRLEGQDALDQVEAVRGAPVYRLRGRLLPLVFLDSVLGYSPDRRTVQDWRASVEDPEQIALNIVVVQADEQQFGLIVDSVNDTEEIVVKPLGRQLKPIKVFAGATIMGDGKLALILDMLGIAQLAGVLGEMARGAGDGTAELVEQGEEDGTEALLLFSAGDSRMAMPLAQVDRLEEFAMDSVERVGDLSCVQYRGSVLPLVSLSAVLFGHSGSVFGTTEASGGATLHVVVASVDGRAAGLVVDQILDITEERLVLQHESPRDGVLGTAVVQGKVTELLDIQRVLQRHAPAPIHREENAA